MFNEAATIITQHNTKITSINYLVLSLSLLAEGGYRQMYLDRVSERQRILTLENAQKYTDEKIVWLTRIIAVGTTIAAYYYSIEIWKFYNPWYHN